MRKLLSGLLFLAAIPAGAQQSTPFDFSIKNIMRGPELYGRPPGNIHWSADSKWIYFTWLEPGTDWRETPKQFRVRATPGAKPERVSIQQVDFTFSRAPRGGGARTTSTTTVRPSGVTTEAFPPARRGHRAAR